MGYQKCEILNGNFWKNEASTFYGSKILCWLKPGNSGARYLAGQVTGGKY